MGKIVKLESATLNSKAVSAKLKAEILSVVPSAKSFVKRHVPDVGYVLYIKNADKQNIAHVSKVIGECGLSQIIINVK